MRAARNGTLLLTAALLLGPGVSEGKKSRKRRAAPKAASKKATTEINLLLGKLKWGMPASQVLGQTSKEIRTAFQKRIAAEKEPIKQDRLRSERDAALRKLKDDHVRFEGKSTPWDRSLVDGEFAHKNDESVVVRWGDRDRKFYFFHKDKLWKVYIAFNAGLYRNKTFEDFAAVMERRFGPAERKYKMNLKGEAVMSHLEWPPAGPTTLLAIDNTDFYGNFCLVLIDRSEAKRVRQGRQANNPKRQYSDPLVDKVTRKAAHEGGDAHDIVDRITGKRVDIPADGETSKRTAPRRKPKQGKGLEGLDL